MGDNQNWTEKIAPEQVIAKVSEIRKKDGRVLTESRFAGKMTIARLYVSKFVKRAFRKIKRVLGGKKTNEK